MLFVADRKYNNKRNEKKENKPFFQMEKWTTSK